jgi:hypothetical protein
MQDHSDHAKQLKDAQAMIARKDTETADLKKSLEAEKAVRNKDKADTAQRQGIPHSQIAMQKAEIDRLTALDQQRQERIAELIHDPTATQSERDHLKARRAWLKAELEKVKEVLGCMKASVSGLASKCEELMQQQALQSRVATVLGHRCVSQGRMIPHLEQLLESRKADCRRLQTDLNNVRRECAVVTAERNTAQALVISQIKRIRDANAEQFQHIRELHSEEICAIIDHYEDGS